MVECEYCGYDPGTSYSQCSLCGGTFCKIHKLPPDHQCVKIDEWKNEDGVKKVPHADPEYSSDEKNLKFFTNDYDEHVSSSNKGKIATLVLGIGLIISGVILFILNRSGLFLTFPYAGFFTMTIGFVILSFLMKPT